jgi:hypothetical protein
MILMQIMAAADTSSAANTSDSFRIIDLLFQGGFMMIPIILLWIAAV